MKSFSLNVFFGMIGMIVVSATIGWLVLILRYKNINSFKSKFKLTELDLILFYQSHF